MKYFLPDWEDRVYSHFNFEEDFFPSISKNAYEGSVYAHEIFSEPPYDGLLISLALGQAVLSGYAHEIYEPLLQNGWHKVEIDTVCHAAGKVRGSRLQGEGSARQHVRRVEVLYLKLRNETLLF